MNTSRCTSGHLGGSFFLRSFPLSGSLFQRVVKQSRVLEALQCRKSQNRPPQKKPLPQPVLHQQSSQSGSLDSSAQKAMPSSLQTKLRPKVLTPTSQQKPAPAEQPITLYLSAKTRPAMLPTACAAPATTVME